MGDLLEYLASIKQGYQSRSFAKKHEGFRGEAQDIAYWGDPSGNIVGYDDHAKRPIYEGGYFDTAHVSSELNRNIKEARNEEGPINIPWERSMAIEDAGSNPYRLGGLDDPYADYTGGSDANYYTGSKGLLSLSGVGVSGVRGGAVGDEIDNYLTNIMRASNLSGDYITSTSSQRGRGKGSQSDKYFKSVYQTPQGELESSQLGSGRGATQYFKHPTEGSGSWGYKGLLGMLGIPTGAFNPK